MCLYKFTGLAAYYSQSPWQSSHCSWAQAPFPLSYFWFHWGAIEALNLSGTAAAQAAFVDVEGTLCP